MRSLGRLSQALALAIVLALGLVLALAHPRFLLGTLVGDDAGYYLAIARNAALGHGLSFDRLHPTNGFNPLLPLLLVPLDRLLAPGLGLVSCFRVAALVTWAALAASLLSLRSLARSVLEEAGLEERERTVAVGAVLLFAAGFVAPKGYYGMDAFLVLALGLAYLDRVARRGLLSPGLGAIVADGALLGGCVLARIDSIPLVAVAFAMMLARARGPASGHPAARAWAGIAARAACVGAIVGPYLVWNRARFGDWLPISARLKSAFPHWDPAASVHTVLHTSLNPADVAALFLALLVSAGWTLARLARPRNAAGAGGPGSALVAMDVWAVYVAARILWVLLWSRLDVQGSYFILAHPFVALAAIVAGSRAAGVRGARVAAVLLVAAGVGLAAAKLAATLPSVRAIATGRGDEWAIARRVHDVTREGDVLYGGAFGLIGYIADRPWINGDGVANDRAYQDAIRDHRLAAHLARDGVDAVAFAALPDQWSADRPIVLTIASVLHGARDTLRLDPHGLLLREPMRRGGGSELWLVRATPARDGR